MSCQTRIATRFTARCTTHFRALIYGLPLALTLAACGSVPPAPGDNFYRLQAVNTLSHTPPAGSLSVRSLRADSLYAERPIIYSEESNPRQLRQYHYHLWLYPPAQLVQEHLAGSLGQSSALNTGSSAAYEIDGRIVRFERRMSGKQSTAVVALELQLTTRGKAGPNKSYQAEQTASDDTLPAFAAAMEQALAKIYAQFLADTPLPH